ncbi:MAG: T9SS type A sorting domain-containing protein [Bacteroidota bacterium]
MRKRKPPFKTRPVWLAVLIFAMLLVSGSTAFGQDSCQTAVSADVSSTCREQFVLYHEGRTEYWFSFVANDTSMNVQAEIMGMPIGMNTFLLQLYGGPDCNNLTLLGSSTGLPNVTLTQGGLVLGNTYYAKLSYYNPAELPEFWICVVGGSINGALNFTTDADSVQSWESIGITNTSSGFNNGQKYLWDFNGSLLYDSIKGWGTSMITESTWETLRLYARDAGSVTITLFAIDSSGNTLPLQPFSKMIVFSSTTFLCNTACHEAIFDTCENYVCNYSFEFSTECVKHINMIEIAEPWCKLNGTPEYFNSNFCPIGTVLWVGVPQNIAGFQYAHTGQAYAGLFLYINNDPNEPDELQREYMGSPLKGSLIPGERYKVELYANRSNKSRYATNGLHAYFSNGVPSQPAPHGQINPVLPNVLVGLSSSIIYDTINWTHCSNIFIPTTANLNWITIGNFKTNGSFSLYHDNSMTYGSDVAYYLIDDVVVKPMPPDVHIVADNDTICKNSAVELCVVGTGAGSYLWSTGDTSHCIVVYPVQTTIYTVTVVNHTHCDTVVLSDTIYVLPSSPLPIISGSMNTCHPTVQCTIENYNPLFIYSWTTTLPNFTNVITSNAFTAILTLQTPSAGDTIWIMQTDTNGCNIIASFYVFPCCRATLDQVEWNDTLASEVIANLGINNFSGNAVINGTLTIDQDFGWYNSVIKMGPNAKVIVEPGRMLSVDKTTIDAGCDYMWDGIYVMGNTAYFRTSDSTMIKDAENAVVSVNGGSFYLRSTWFTRNYTSVKVLPYQGTVSGVIRQTSFWSQDNNAGSSLSLIAPRSGQRPYAGIDVTGSTYAFLPRTRLFVGDTINANGRNYFAKLQNGIVNDNADVYVYNNTFDSLGYISFGSNYGAAINSKSQKVNPGKLTVGNLNTGTIHRSNLFVDCILGVYSNRFQPLTVEYDTFKVSKILWQFISVYSEYAYAARVNINNNKISKAAIGIRVLRLNAGSRVTMYNNVLDTLTVSGIMVQNVVPSTFSAIAIRYNQIRKAVNGIITTNLTGKKFVPVLITDNTVKYANPSFSSLNYGIRVQNCPWTKLEENTVIQLTPVVPVTTAANAIKLTGIGVELSPNAYLCKNTTNNMGCGLRFYGTMPGSTVRVNSMTDDYYGIRLDTAYLGNQYTPGSTPVAYGNKFYGTMNMRIQGTWTPFKWYYNVTPNSLSLIPIYIAVAPPLLTNFISTTAYYTDCPTTTLLALNETVVSIANDAIDYVEAPNENKKLDKKFAYRELKDDPAMLQDLTASNPEVFSFYNEQDNDNNGKFEKLHDKVDSDEWEDAKEMNRLINPGHKHDENMKDVYEIYFNTWMQGRHEFTEAEYQTLFDIAMQRPILGGTGVYSARVMLGIEGSGMESLKIIPQDQQNEEVQEEYISHLFPNPANETATLNYSIPEGSKAVLCIYTITGQIIRRIDLESESTSVSVDLKELKSGVYLYYVEMNNRKLINDKLILIK